MSDMTTQLISLSAILTDTGTQFKLDVKPGQTLGHVIALHTAIAVHDQIILSADGEPISDSEAAMRASLPLFIYSRRTLDSSQTSAGQRAVSVRFDFEPLYEHGVLHSDIKQNVINLDFDKGRFRDYIRYITQALQIVYENSQRQLQSLRIALLSLDKHVRAYDGAVQEFADAFSEFSQQTETFGANFEEFIRRLSLVEIHPSLSHRQETLLDRLSEGRLRSIVSRSQRDHQLVSEFVTQVYQQRKTIVDACRGESELLEEPATASALFCFPFTPLYHLKQLCCSFRKIDSEINDVRVRVNANIIRSVIGERQNDLLNMEQLQLDMMEFIRNRLGSISDIQTRIRHETKRLLAYNEVLSQKQTNLSNLRTIESVPEAYFATLIEIIRRRSYIQKIDAIVKQIEALRTNEVKTRSIYMEEFGRLLPKEIFTGLDRRPVPYVLSQESINEDLPCIESLENVELPPTLQLTHQFFEMVRGLNLDEMMLSKLPYAMRRQLSGSDVESTEGNSEFDRIRESLGEGRPLSDSLIEDQTAAGSDDRLIAEIESLRARISEKDRRISELENEKDNLTMSTALLYQENKALNDMISRPHVVLNNFQVGDLVAVLPESKQMLNIGCQSYRLANDCIAADERSSGQVKIGTIKRIQQIKNQKQNIVDVEFLSQS